MASQNPQKKKIFLTLQKYPFCSKFFQFCFSFAGILLKFCFNFASIILKYI